MTTKIVYILTSDENDYYWEQTYLSAYSLRLHNPDSEVVLVTDQFTALTLKGFRARIMDYISGHKVVNVPEEFSKKRRSRFLKTSLRRHIAGDYLFIDSDTVIARPLAEIDTFPADCAAVLDHHIPLAELLARDSSLKYVTEKYGSAPWNGNGKYFNSGSMLVREAPDTYRLYDEWHAIWIRQMNDGIDTDQQSLRQADYKCGDIIRELPGEWNCQITKNGLRYLADAYVIHYFTAKCTPLLLGQEDVFKELRAQKAISPETEKMIRKPATAFPLHCRVCTGDSFELLQTKVTTLFFYHRWVFDLFERIAKMLVRKQ